MAQHFLLSASARTLSLKEIYAAGEDAAYATFRKIRWTETNGEAICPRCGCCDAYTIATRRKFKCKGCGHQFSVTSGTIFASRKLSFVDLRAAICIFVTNAKGMSAVQFSRTMDVQYKTAWVMAHKLREALALEVRGAELDGEVEIDGAYFGGVVRPENRKEDRKDRRLKANRSDRRRVVIVLRERQGRTLTFVGKEEAEGVSHALRLVDRAAVMHADEGSHWDLLDPFFASERVNHSREYSRGHGKHTNWVESYFSRLRRMIGGQHHFVSAQYLGQYASHAAWIEDHRGEGSKALVQRVVANVMAAPVSRAWKGYWQRAA